MKHILPSVIFLFKQKSMNSAMRLFVPAGHVRLKKQAPWMFHLMKVHDAEVTNISYETDRDQFIGRGNSINQPAGNEASRKFRWP